jgi:hypothetical protein
MKNWSVSVPFKKREEIVRTWKVGTTYYRFIITLFGSGYKGKYKVRFISSFSTASCPQLPPQRKMSQITVNGRPDCFVTGFGLMIQPTDVLVKYLKA